MAPFHGRATVLAALLVAVPVVACAFALTHQRWLQSRRECPVEIRTVTNSGKSASAFVVPTSALRFASLLTVYVFLVGAASSFVIEAVRFPVKAWGLWIPVLVGCSGLGLGLLGTVVCLILLLSDSYFLALLPEGVLFSTGKPYWYVPWTAIMECKYGTQRMPFCAKPVPVKLVLRVSDTSQVVAAPRTQERIAKAKVPPMWHIGAPAAIFGVSAFRLANLVWLYVAQPARRPNIGTEGELAAVQAAWTQAWAKEP